jgi:hypothetical protein
VGYEDLLALRADGTGVVSVSTDAAHVLAGRADGTAVSWGLNGDGVIGDGLSPLHSTPVRVRLHPEARSLEERESP